MLITLLPVRMDQPLTASREGSVLVLNGTAVDLTGYDAATAPNPWITGQPVEADGLWHLSLILPHGGDAPDETRFPAALALAGDGPVNLPPYDAAPDDAAPEDAEANV